MLTAKQKEVMNAIKRYYSNYGYSPTIRELCSLTKTKSSSTIHAHLKNLEEKQYISMQESKPRTIMILEDGWDESIS